MCEKKDISNTNKQVMYSKYKQRVLILLFAGSICFTACKKWEDHNEVNNQDLTINLLQAVAADENLSTFREFIMKTGLDTALQSSKNYTVWAPTNDALKNLDQSIVNDVTKLRAFVKNHIATQNYFIRDAATGTRVPVLTGKYNSFEKGKYDEATITTADHFVSNGVLHIIDKPVPVRENIWEFINNTTAIYQQNEFVVARNYIDRDLSLAIVDSISLITGDPVYRPGTGYVTKNSFIELTYDVKQEDKLYTYFVITNPNFNVEVDSLKPYFKSGTSAFTDTISKLNTAKDLVVQGLYPANALPAYVLSKNGTPVPIRSADIIETKKLSNGIAYIMSNVDVPTAYKFREFRIEGEKPTGFQTDKSGNVNYRVRYDTINKRTYNDLMVSGHGISGYYSYYTLPAYPSMKYQVYALGVNDFQATAFSQNIVVKSYVRSGNVTTYNTLTTLAHAVPLSTAAGAFNEKLLGEFTTPAFAGIEFQLTAATTNPLVLDYLRIVPVPFP
jgi:uncharacterized surface protein with fasciclin (FAS1) repeats